MPSGVHDPWVTSFLEHLAFCDREVSELIEVAAWSRANVDMTKAFVREADLIVVYGSDGTIEQIKGMAVQTPVVAYGHRVSAGVVMSGSDFDTAATGLAVDILLYDQAGCLSPHCIFVDGAPDDGLRFANMLASKLRTCSVPLPTKNVHRDWRVQEHRQLVMMDENSTVIDFEETRWTVIYHDNPVFHLSITHGFVYVVALPKEGIIECIEQAAHLVQGVALESGDMIEFENVQSELRRAGASYVCSPGKLQQPTISWRENNEDVLRSLTFWPMFA
jgi:hypothetical protein